MKKKALLLVSIGVLASTVGVTALAVGGTGKFGNVLVHAEPDPDVKPGEYSVTFDGESSIEEHNDDGIYAICETTENGNKLGVAGWGKWYPHLSFHGTNFLELQLHDDSNALRNNGANDFDHITGYKISFEGESPLFFKMGLDPMAEGSSVTSGLRYNVSLGPDDYPAFATDEYSEDVVTITSLTIYYTC